MKFAPMLALLMFPYGALVPQSPGNPNGDAYAGQAGSTYDASANPARTVGTVNYNPNAPLPPSAAGSALSNPTPSSPPPAR